MNLLYHIFSWFLSKTMFNTQQRPSLHRWTILETIKNASHGAPTINVLMSPRMRCFPAACFGWPPMMPREVTIGTSPPPQEKLWKLENPRRTEKNKQQKTNTETIENQTMQSNSQPVKSSDSFLPCLVEKLCCMQPPKTVFTQTCSPPTLYVVLGCCRAWGFLKDPDVSARHIHMVTWMHAVHEDNRPQRPHPRWNKYQPEPCKATAYRQLWSFERRKSPHNKRNHRTNRWTLSSFWVRPQILKAMAVFTCHMPEANHLELTNLLRKAARREREFPLFQVSRLPNWESEVGNYYTSPTIQIIQNFTILPKSSNSFLPVSKYEYAPAFTSVLSWKKKRLSNIDTWLYSLQAS